MKKTMALLLLAAMLCGLLSPFSLSAENPGLNGYVTNGLVSLYRGSYNTRDGYKADTLVWEDLAGGNDIPVENTEKNYFTESAFHVDRSEFLFPKALLSVINQESFTVELTLGDFETLSGNTYATLINTTSNDNFALFWRASGDFLEFKAASNSRPKVSGGAELFRDSTVSLCFTKGETCRVYVDGWLITETPVKALIGGTGTLKFGNKNAGKTHVADYESIRFYNRALSESEVIANATADGNYDPDRVFPEDFATVKQPQTPIIGDIAFSQEVESQEELSELLSSETKPSGLLFYVNSSLAITDREGKKSFSTVDSVYDALDGEFLPIFYVQDAATVSALCDKLKSRMIEDAFVISDDLALLKQVRTEYGILRSIADYSELSDEMLTTEQLISIRKNANSSGCKVVLLPWICVTDEEIAYLNERSMTVWVKTDHLETDAEALSLLLSGSYGIVGPSTEKLLAAASQYLEEGTLTRAPLNVAHRGYHTEHPENTIEAMEAAYEAGADMLEIDLYLTADKELAICHNSTTGSLFNRSLVVESSTMKRLKTVYISQNGKQYFMPTLREVFEKFKDTDIRFMLEIKSSKLEIVTVMKALIEEYDLYDRCTIITFARTNLYDTLQEVFPEMPVGYLADTAALDRDPAVSAKNIQTLIRENNTHYAPSYTGYTAEQVRACLLRGITSWIWTPNTADAIFTCLLQGHSAITTDDCTALGSYARSISVNLESDFRCPVGRSFAIPVLAKLYSGEEREVSDAKVTVLSGNAVVTEDGRVLAKEAGEITLLVSYTVMLNRNRSYTLYETPMTITAVPPEDLHDVNSDSEVNIQDVTALLATLSQGKSFSDSEKYAADVNGDGIISMKDVTKLLLLLS